MKLEATNLRAYMKKARVGTTELARKINKMQEIIHPGSRPMIKNSMYFYINYGVTPPEDKMYMIGAILATDPRKIFQVIYDPEKMAEYKKILNQLDI